MKGDSFIPAGNVNEPALQNKYIGSSFQYAGFWRRLAAYLIDMFIVLFVWAFILIFIEKVLNIATGGFSIDSPQGDALILPWILSGVLANWIYRAGMESSSYQATLGKMIIGIAVTGSGGEKLSFGRATSRHLLKVFSTIIIVGYIMAGINEQKQAFHDILASCLVVKRRHKDTAQLLWRVYFWFYTLMLGNYYLLETIRVWEVVDMFLAALSLAGLFSFVWKRGILNSVFWKVFLPIFLVWNVIYMYFVPPPFEIESQAIWATVSMLICLPAYWALYRNGFMNIGVWEKRN